MNHGNNKLLLLQNSQSLYSCPKIVVGMQCHQDDFIQLIQMGSAFDNLQLLRLRLFCQNCSGLSSLFYFSCLHSPIMLLPPSQKGMPRLILIWFLIFFLYPVNLAERPVCLHSFTHILFFARLCVSQVELHLFIFTPLVVTYPTCL